MGSRERKNMIYLIVENGHFADVEIGDLYLTLKPRLFFRKYCKKEVRGQEREGYRIILKSNHFSERHSIYGWECHIEENETIVCKFYTFNLYGNADETKMKYVIQPNGFSEITIYDVRGKGKKYRRDDEGKKETKFSDGIIALPLTRTSFLQARIKRDFIEITGNTGGLGIGTDFKEEIIVGNPNDYQSIIENREKAIKLLEGKKFKYHHEIIHMLHKYGIENVRFRNSVMYLG